MTDETQNLPVSESAPKTRRPRRTNPKVAATPVNGDVASGTDSADTPLANKVSVSKTPSRKAADADAPTTKAKQGTRTKSTTGTRSAKSKTAEGKNDATDTQAKEQENAPKPRPRRRASTKTADNAPQSTPALPVLTAESSPLPPIEQTLPSQNSAPAAEKAPVSRSATRRSAPAKSSEQTARSKNGRQDRSPAPMGGRGKHRVESRPDTRPDTPSGERPRRNPRPEDASPAQAEAIQKNIDQPDTLAADMPVAEPTRAMPRQTALAVDADMPADQLDDAVKNIEESHEAENDAASAEGAELPPRKSRRGRRGGRGRSKNKAREAALAGENDSTQKPLDKDSFEKKALAALAEGADNTYDDDAYEDEARTSNDEGREDEDTRERKNSPRTSGRSVRGVRKESAVDAQVDKDLPEKVGRRKMFISVVPGEQVEVALVEDGAIHEYYLEMLHQAKTKGNIYKGVIHNIDTNLQAAFVNYGANKNGFLQIDEVHPEYYLTHHEAMKGKKFPPMQKVLKAGQEVLVQVVKEQSGSKGAFLTTWLSLAGRFLVLTPGQEQIGVSRKVENDEERARLREMMNGIDPGEGLGVIVRTVSAGTSKTTLKNDLQYLKRVWKDIRKRGTSEPTPSLIYQEPGLAERAVRDYLTDDVCEVWVDDAPVAESLRETVSLLFPRKGDLVRVHNDLRQTLWERFNIQRQLEQIYSREVILPSGGRLVFDQTEALMAIDINSGKISGKGNFEAMALKTNVEAADCIARQLKLRDIGGQIVIDFIEMRDKNHIRDVEKTLRNAMKNDRARHDVGRMSSFGLLEIVRQRTASSALAITMEPCPACGGTGLRRNIEWQALQSMREIARQARTCGTGPCQIELSAELGLYLLNHKRSHLREMERQHNVPIEIKIRP